MAGSGKSETTKACGIVSFIVYICLFLVMSFILIGVSVSVCDKVSYKYLRANLFKGKLLSKLEWERESYY